ncbi:hypothetical protein MEBOL_007309 [Melittangium boletus DSM 14713]|uniref:Uncharacterized protein n=1 Tax=Melittangium boletus DSM 14713 TaxID=1294270 RepID=A0A250IRN0_9BACT|nr:hypothetical protein MEBOL_007309 [Melittangium boletus DSM 14713]
MVETQLEVVNPDVDEVSGGELPEFALMIDVPDSALDD